MVITINISDVKEAVKQGKIAFKLVSKDIYCVDVSTQECLLVTNVERKNSSDIQHSLQFGENLNLSFTVVKKRIKPITMFGIREAVENGVIAFERTDKGIYCVDTETEERVLVNAFDEVVDTYFVIYKNTDEGRVFLKDYPTYDSDYITFGSMVNAARFYKISEVHNMIEWLKFNNLNGLNFLRLSRRKVKEI